jgi:hypothetical protein
MRKLCCLATWACLFLATIRSGQAQDISRLKETLNNPNKVTAVEYNHAATNWPSDVPIWPQLIDDEARRNFSHFIIEIVRPKPFVPLACSSPTAGKYVCREFARERFLAFTNNDKIKIEIDPIPKRPNYRIDRAPVKFRVPIREVGTKIGDEGHAFNAIYVGGEAESRLDVKKWVFFEPQRNDILWSGGKIARPTFWSVFGTTWNVDPPRGGSFDIVDFKSPYREDAVSFYMDNEWNLHSVPVIPLGIQYYGKSSFGCSHLFKLLKP